MLKAGTITTKITEDMAGVTMNAAGQIMSGKTTYGSGTGYILEYNDGTPRFDIGSTSQYLRWTGAALDMKGKLTVQNISDEASPGAADVNLVVYDYGGTIRGLVSAKNSGAFQIFAAQTDDVLRLSGGSGGGGNIEFVANASSSLTAEMHYDGINLYKAGALALTSLFVIKADKYVLYEPVSGSPGSESQTHALTLVSPQLAASWDLTLPANDGDSGQFLQTNGSGVTTWATASGAVTSIVAGTGISISGATGDVTVTNTVTDTNTTYSAGAGLDLSSTTFSHTDTSSQASVNNSGDTFIQDITLDTYGHITAITSAAASGGSGDITAVQLSADSGSASNITSGAANFTIAGGTNVTTVSNASDTITINATQRGIDTSPVSGQTAESISSSWAYTHAASATAHQGAIHTHSSSLSIDVNVLDVTRINDNAANTVTVSTDLDPYLTESYDLGSSLKEWYNIFSQNSVTVSDRRKKTNIVDFTNADALAFINSFRPRTFNRIDTDGNTVDELRYGLIAQEVEDTLTGLSIDKTKVALIKLPATETVTQVIDEDGTTGTVINPRALNYTELIAPLIGAVKALTARVEALEGG